VRARCVGDQPIALAGVNGGLCPFGVVAHHLPYHPARIKQGPVDEARSAIAAALATRRPDEGVAVLDLRPGRTASWTYRRAMASLAGLYIAPPQPSVAVNLGAAKTVLSLGAPLFDGWASPANVFAVRDRFRLIQAEAVESRTAALADEWLSIRPGSEFALALAVAGAMSVSETADATGASALQIAAILRELSANGPSLVIDNGMSPEVLTANVKLGAWGKTIGPRPEAPIPASWKNAAPVTELAAIPDRSIRVLLIDESAPGEYLPWKEIERKLLSDAVVTVFGWSKLGYGRHAQYLLPTPVFPEVLDDLPPAIDSSVAAFRIAAPLVPPPAGAVSPAEFLAGLAGFPAADALRERAGAIHKMAAPKGTTPDDFWKSLSQGGQWIADAPPKASAPAPNNSPSRVPEQAVVADSGAFPLTVVFTKTLDGRAPASPLLSKVYQESGVRLAPFRIALHPDTARLSGVAEGKPALLSTSSGSASVGVSIDRAIPPGIVQLADGPGILDVFRPGAHAKVVAS
jgi:hypothetical protein